ncbi:MAG: HlyC/CorC family transporter [Lachnospiraceae bacterium]|nr:HlyC/CorC family transporter [Lachnospiraceae bacterium]
MDSEGVIQLIVLGVLVVLSSFFSASETALVSLNRVKVRSLAEEGRKHSKTLEKVISKYDRMITTILVGNNIVNLSASALATALTIRLWGNIYVSLATGALTLLILIFGEIIPKTLARRHCEGLSLAVAPVIRFLMVLLFPIVFVLDKIVLFFFFITGQKDVYKNRITESEFRTYVNVSHEDGVIESDEKAIINNVFDFRESVAKDIMIPRIDMTSISINATYKEVMKVFRESMYTRLPVYRDEKENIIGFINIKDLIRLKDSASFTVSKFLREAYYTYEFKKTNDLLVELRNASINLAFVNDEYGDTVGMITLEDLLEEIVGEIRDEYDQDEAGQIKQKDGGYLIEAKMRLEDINDAIGTSFESEDYDTIGGLVLDQLDRIPEDKETVSLADGTLLKVVGIKQNRIVNVFVRLPESEPDDEDKETKEKQ